MRIEDKLEGIPEHEQSQGFEQGEPGEAPPEPGAPDLLRRVLNSISAPAKKTPVSQYLSHPLNFAESPAIGRVLRGIEGLLGDLDYAVIDIVLGGIEFLGERRSRSEQN